MVPEVIRSHLGPGDTFIDIGANRGVHTMFACRNLTAGRVFSFEPNPRTCQVLQAHLTINALSNCTVQNVGVGDADGTLELNLFADDAPSGCSFIDKGENPVQETFTVPVRRLDSVLSPADLRGRVLAKIDTEGFEHQVIQGMGALLDHDRLAIFTEVQDDWLRRAGSSAQSLFDDLVGRGFRAYDPRIRFRGLVGQALDLVPLEELPARADQFDILFARPAFLAQGPRDQRS
jgi:FkbM family methyltransferase